MEIKIGMIPAVHADELKFLGVPAVRQTLDHADRPTAQDYRPPQRGLVDIPHGFPFPCMVALLPTRRRRAGARGTQCSSCRRNAISSSPFRG
jgi:hypothetical protein